MLLSAARCDFKFAGAAVCGNNLRINLRIKTLRRLALNSHRNILLEKERSHKSQERIKGPAANTKFRCFFVVFLLFLLILQRLTVLTLIDPHFLLRNTDTHIYGLRQPGTHTHTHMHGQLAPRTDN